jgi:uncharacterized protein (DUF697 family)/tellurite resistance protein
MAPQEEVLTGDDVRGIVSLALMAATVDGRTTDSEREEIRKIAESLGGQIGGATPLSFAALWQDVLLRRISMESAVSSIRSQEARSLAYELCVCVCDADGSLGPEEQKFLDQLRQHLALGGKSATDAEDFKSKADTLAATPLAKTIPNEPEEAQRTSTLDAAEQDKMILNYAILNGALEILPDSLATMAIVPLQMKMVYRIGKTYGFELDRTHIKDFLATAGVGLTAQYMEQVGTRLVGGLLKSIGGKSLGGIAGIFAKQAVSSGFSFATTWALGHLAKRYYAGGRKLSGQMLRDTYTELLTRAKGMQGSYQEQIQQRAKTVNVAQLLKDVAR